MLSGTEVVVLSVLTGGIYWSKRRLTPNPSGKSNVQLRCCVHDSWTVHGLWQGLRIFCRLWFCTFEERGALNVGSLFPPVYGCLYHSFNMLYNSLFFDTPSSFEFIPFRYPSHTLPPRSTLQFNPSPLGMTCPLSLFELPSLLCVRTFLTRFSDGCSYDLSILTKYVSCL